MSTTDIVLAAVLFGPGIAISIPVLLSQRGARADSEAIRTALALSAAERAAALAAQDQDGPTPPPAREPAPQPTPATVEHLATVIPFPTSRAA